MIMVVERTVQAESGSDAGARSKPSTDRPKSNITQLSSLTHSLTHSTPPNLTLVTPSLPLTLPLLRPSPLPTHPPLPQFTPNSQVRRTRRVTPGAVRARLTTTPKAVNLHTPPTPTPSSTTSAITRTLTTIPTHKAARNPRTQRQLQHRPNTTLDQVSSLSTSSHIADQQAIILSLSISTLSSPSYSYRSTQIPHV